MVEMRKKYSKASDLPRKNERKTAEITYLYFVRLGDGLGMARSGVDGVDLAPNGIGFKKCVVWSFRARGDTTSGLNIVPESSHGT